MNLYETLHTANVAVHVTAGTLALAFGLANIINGKGSRRHRSFGRWFMWSIGVVLVTATIGVVYFDFRAFLAVLTLLVAYQAVSGYRVLVTKEQGPQRIDLLLSIAGIVSAIAFIVYIQSVNFPWSPVIIYSTLGWLVFLSLYDMARFLFPKQWYEQLWVYEHLFKLIGSFGAIISAFLGNVVRGGQPYTQILPSVFSFLLTILFVVLVYRKRVRIL